MHISKDHAFTLDVFARRIGTEMEWVNNDIILKAQEEKLRSIITTLPNPIYVQNNEGIYQNCNSAFLHFFGINETDIIKKTANKLPKIISNNTILSATHTLKKTTGTSRFETMLTLHNGVQKNAIITITPITNKDDERTGIVGIIQDISEMKEAEKLLKLREEKYRTLFTNANDAFLLMSKASPVSTIIKSSTSIVAIYLLLYIKLFLLSMAICLLFLVLPFSSFSNSS